MRTRPGSTAAPANATPPLSPPHWRSIRKQSTATSSSSAIRSGTRSNTSHGNTPTATPRRRLPSCEIRNPQSAIRNRMSAVITRSVPRFRLKVGARDIGEFALDELRDVRDAADSLITGESTGAETVLTLTCVHFGIRRDALNIGRGAENLSSCRLTAMALVKEFCPLLTDTTIAGLFGRERSLASYARPWLRDRQESDRLFAA